MDQLKGFERKGEYILCQKEISTALIKNNTSQTTSVVND